MFEGFFSILKAFEAAGIKDPLKETLNVLDAVSCGAVRNMDEDFSAIAGLGLRELIEKRCSGIPLEYALGYGTFMGMRFSCSPAALIPRQETELLAKTAILLANNFYKGNDEIRIVDMGTGSGNIAVSIAIHVKCSHIMACDVSPEAIEIARSNTNRHGLASQITFFCGDLFEPLSNGRYQGSVDMIVCNPPYIPSSSLAKLSREIIDNEPIVALDAGDYGIDIFRRIITQSPEFLQPKGVLVFEIGQGQYSFVTRLIEKAKSYTDIRHYADKSGQTRVISAVNG